MRFLFRNFHVFVFTFVSVFVALVIAKTPDKAIQFVQPLVEDAVELQKLATGVYGEISQTDWQSAADEAVAMYVAALRMPSQLFEHLADRLEEVEKDMSLKQEPLPGQAEDQGKYAASL